MRLNVTDRLPWDLQADVLAVTMPAASQMPEYLQEIDRRLDGALSAMRELGALTGSRWQTRLLPARGMGVRAILAIGVGEDGGLDELATRRLGSLVVRSLVGCEVRSLAVYLPAPAGASEAEVASAVELVARGIVEGTADPAAIYREAPEKLPPEIDTCTLVVDAGDLVQLGQRAERGRIIGEGGNRTRRLAQRAGNDVSPEVLADEASDLAREHGLELTVLGPEEAAALGMGMFMAVGKGSANPPRFIALRSQPASRARPAWAPAGDGRQGRHLRHRRHQPEAAAQHGRDEDRQDAAPARSSMPSPLPCSCRPSGRCWPWRRPSRTCPARTHRAPAT